MEKEKKHHIEQSDGSMLIDFSDRPLKIDGTEVKKLVMREPSVEDEETSVSLAGNSGEREIILFANLTEQPPETIRKFKLRQYKRLQAAYEDFLS